MSWAKIGKNKYKLDVERQINKKRKRKTKTINTNLKGRDLSRYLQSKEDEIYDLLGSSDYIEYNNIIYEDFVDVFISSRVAEGKTIDFYKSCLGGHSLKYFSGKKIVDIKRGHVIDFIRNLQKHESNVTKDVLSPKTVKHHRDCLRALFNYAIYLEIIDKNPAEHIKLDPAPNQIDGRYYEPEDIDRLISALEQDGDYKYYVFFILQLYTGCRPSEIYGLTWNKVDFDRKEITIDQALVKSKSAGGYVLKSTKARDTRVKPLPISIASMLKKLDHTNLSKSDYVFTNAHGGHLGEGAFREYLRRFCRAHDLPYIPPYGIRHTTGTLLAAKGIPIVNVAKQLGHSNTQTTTKYVHATQSIDDKANDILADVVKPKLRLVR